MACHGVCAHWIRIVPLVKSVDQHRRETQPRRASVLCHTSSSLLRRQTTVVTTSPRWFATPGRGRRSTPAWPMVHQVEEADHASAPSPTHQTLPLQTTKTTTRRRGSPRQTATETSSTVGHSKTRRWTGWMPHPGRYRITGRWSATICDSVKRKRKCENSFVTSASTTSSHRCSTVFESQVSATFRHERSKNCLATH